VPVEDPIAPAKLLFDCVSLVPVALLRRFDTPARFPPFPKRSSIVTKPTTSNFGFAPPVPFTASRIGSPDPPENRESVLGVEESD